MEPNTPNHQLWNALVTGGDSSANAIADFTALSERQREAVFKQLFHQAGTFVDNLIAEERKGTRHDFRVVKEKLIRVLDALPYLTVTDSLRDEATKRLADLDKRSEPLTNIDIAMKCDEIAKKLEPPTLGTLKTPHVIECSSIAELKEKLAHVLPPEVANEVITQIEKDGAGIIFGMQAIIKKTPPPKE
jgi:hypothetical protein